MTSELYKLVNYISGLRFLFSTYIREYDISKANINVLYSAGVIDKNLYERLLVAPREERQITIGLMEQRDRKITKIKAAGICKAKQDLFEANDIQDQDILSIKNDAVFILNKNLKYTEFGNIKFVLKNTYTEFVLLNGIEVYYGYDKVKGTENIDTKGLGKNKYLHDEFMTDFIVYVLSELSVGNVEDAIKSFSDFFNDYINGDLDIGYYREYNPASMYSILNSSYKISLADNNIDKLKVININYNMNILRELFGYISNKYFTDMRF